MAAAKDSAPAERPVLQRGRLSPEFEAEAIQGTVEIVRVDGTCRLADS